MKVTMKDIAKLAGISHTTVSRVINDHKNVNSKTRERVEEIIKRFEYVPQVNARSLRSIKKKYAVGLLPLYDIKNLPCHADFFQEILMGVVSKLHKSGYILNLFFNEDDFRLISKDKIDGLIIIGIESNFTYYIYRLFGLDVPIVMVNQKIDIPELRLSAVISDDENGSYQATSYLLNLGHKEIGFINGPPKYSPCFDRKKGYIKALRERKIDIKPNLIKEGNFTRESGYKVGLELLKENPRISSVFAANDLMALGIIKSIKENGLQVPRDISVIGFDNIAFSKMSDPSLTTINKPRELMGNKAVEILLKQINKPNEFYQQEIILPTNLIIRESTASK